MAKCRTRSCYRVNILYNPWQFACRHSNCGLRIVPLVVVSLGVVEDSYLLSSVLAGDLKNPDRLHRRR